METETELKAINGWITLGLFHRGYRDYVRRDISRIAWSEDCEISFSESRSILDLVIRWRITGDPESLQFIQPIVDRYIKQFVGQ